MQQPNKNKKKTSWELQQEKVKAEKDAKLKALLAKGKPVYKEKTFEEKLVEKLNEEKFKNIKKADNTKVVKNNNAKNLSKVARNKTDEEIAEERKAIREKSDANVLNSWSLDFFKPSNYTKENVAEMAQGLESKFRFSDKPNLFDDYLNPANMIGGMAANLGQAPLRAQQTDSYMPYVTSIGTPLAVGALAGLGTQNTGQFVNNLTNPLVGTGDLVNNLGNKYLPNAYKLNPLARTSENFNNPNSFYRQVDDETFREGLESGLIKGKQNVDKTRGESIINLNKSFGDDAYYKKSSLYSPQRADYIYEVQKGEEAFIPKVNNRTRGYTTENTPIRVSREPIPLTEANIYQKDWLKGYKQIEVPKTTQFTYGGNLQQQTNNNNMLNEFNEGGTHDQNPLGGIPQGMGQNGQMNTVEEGETKKDSFVYSNRIILTPEVIAQFSLPKSLTGKTVADATKLINNKFEGRNSQIDNSTKKNFLDRIAEAQETVKAEEQSKIAESMQANSQEVPDMMDGQVPQGMEEFMQPQQQMFNGGELSQGLSMLGASGVMGQHTGINQVTTALDLGNTAFGKTGIDTSGATDINPGTVKPGMMGVTGALKGAQAGAMFGPIGAGVGAAVGLGAGLIGGNRAKKDALRAHQNFQIGEANNKISNFAFGGNLGDPKKPSQEDFALWDKSFKSREDRINMHMANPNIMSDNYVLGSLKASTMYDKFDEATRKQAEKDYYLMLEAQKRIKQSKQNRKALGGMLGDPTKDPKLAQTSTKTSTIVNNNDPRVKRFNDAAGVQFTAEGVNNLMADRNPVTSQYKPIYNIQTGVTGKDGVEGVYYYYGDRTKGFNPETDRDFIPMKTHNELMNSKDPNYINPYIRKYHQLTGGRNNMQVQYGKGGNMYNDGGPFDKSMASYDATKINSGLPTTTSNPFLDSLNYAKSEQKNLISLTPEQLNEPSGWHEKPSIVPENTTTSEQTKMGKALSKTGEFMKDNYGNILRYSPVAMNAYQLAKMGKPEVENLDRLNNKYNPQYMDEKALTNQINSEMNNTATGLAGTSGGSLGALRNNMLGMQLNKTKALSDAYSKVADVNRNENKVGQQFDLGVDQFNVGQSNMEKDINARNRGAFKTERSKLLSQMGNDLGNIGKEEVYKKLAKEAFNYTYDGKYVKDDKGEIVKDPTTGEPLTKEQLEKTKKYAQQFKTMGQKEFGSLGLNNKNIKE